MEDFKPLDLFGEGIEQPAPQPETVPQPEAAEPVQEAAPQPEQETPVCGEEPEPVQEPEVPEEDEVQEEPAPDPCGEKLTELTEAACRMEAQIAALSDLFQAKIMHAAHEDRIIDQMHRELQKYKEDMYAQLVRPILMDVIEVRDSIMRVGAVYRSKPEGEQDIPNKTFSDYAYDLQDILEKNQVEIYRSQPGDDYTPIRQRVVKKVTTHDEALHGKVAESMSSGYSYNGRVISAEKVTIYSYEKPAETEEASEVIENG